MCHHKILGSKSAYVSITFLFASLVASQAQSQLLYVDLSHNPGDGTVVTRHKEGTSGTIADSLTISGASGQASAQFGKIRADAQASWLAISPPDPQRWGFRGARSTGGWQDEVTINAPVPLGTQGTFTAKLGVNGMLNASGNGNAGWILEIGNHIDKFRPFIFLFQGFNLFFRDVDQISFSFYSFS